jgi:phosphoribosyl 1,2-cyclic phosphate phosphodiesterase
MKIHFLGTGAAEGVPAMFCTCEFCKNIRKLGESEVRTRSQVLIDGILSVDFPPEAYVHSLKYNFNLSSLKYILVTHSHMDHFYAHDFILRGYKYATLAEKKLQIFGNSEVGKVFAECTAREMKEEVKPNVAFCQIEPYSEFEFDGYRVLTLPANHSKSESALMFYIEKDGKGYLHLYDTGLFKGEVFDFLTNKGVRADVVAFDCTFAEHEGGYNARHMGIQDNMILKSELLSRGLVNESTKYIITHFSHNSNPLRERLAKIEREYSVTSAFDGYEIEI